MVVGRFVVVVGGGVLGAAVVCAGVVGAAFVEFTLTFVVAVAVVLFLT